MIDRILDRLFPSRAKARRSEREIRDPLRLTVVALEPIVSWEFSGSCYISASSVAPLALGSLVGRTNAAEYMMFPAGSVVLTNVGIRSRRYGPAELTLSFRWRGVRWPSAVYPPGDFSVLPELAWRHSEIDTITRPVEVS